MNNPVLIVGAMRSETQELRQMLGGSTDVVVLRAGIGVANTIYYLEKQLLEINPRLVINIGVIGSYSPDLRVGDLLIADGSYNGNSYRTDKHGCRELMTWVDGGKDLPQKPLLTDKSSSDKMMQFFEENREAVARGYVNSGDMWTSDVKIMQDLKQKYNIMGEDMELWGVLFVCQQHQIPVVSLKIVSNNCLYDEDYKPENGQKIQKLIINFLRKEGYAKNC